VRTEAEILDFLRQKPASTQEIVAHFKDISPLLVHAFLNGLYKEQYIEIKDGKWHIKA